MKNHGLRGLFLVVALCVTTHAGRAVFPGYDWQVMGWKNRSNTNNGSSPTSHNADVSCSTELAATEFMRAIRTAGFYPGSTNVGKILRLNLFAGNDFHNGNSDTCLGAVQTPLIIDVGNSLDTTPQAQGTFTYTEKGSTGGLNGAGASQLQTGFVPSTALSSITNIHFGIYITVPGAASSTWSMGTQDGSGNECGLIGPDFTAVGTRGDAFIVGNAASDAGGKGFYLVVRDSATDASVDCTTYKNGVAQSTKIGAGGTLSTTDIWVLCLNLNGSRSSASSKTFGGYTIGTLLGLNQQTTLYNAFQRFETCLGRQQ